MPAGSGGRNAARARGRRDAAAHPRLRGPGPGRLACAARQASRRGCRQPRPEALPHWLAGGRRHAASGRPLRRRAKNTHVLVGSARRSGRGAPTSAPQTIEENLLGQGCPAVSRRQLRAWSLDHAAAAWCARRAPDG